MEIISLDLSRRVDPFFSRFDFLKNGRVKRVVEVALPYICLHEGASAYVSMGSAASQVYHHLRHESFSTRKTAGLVSGAALVFFQPRLSFYFTHGFSAMHDLYAIGHDLRQGKLEAFKEKGYHLVSTLIYLGSMGTSLPTLIVASLLFQALDELKSAVSEGREGRYLEMAGKLGMALIRFAKAHAEAELFYIDAYGKEVEAEDLKLIKKELKEKPQDVKEKVKQLLHDPFGKESDLEKILRKHRFKREMKDLTFDDEFWHETVRNIRFKNCVFTDSDFSSNQFEQVVFDHCMMEKARFVDATFQNVMFWETDLSKSNFYHAKLKNCVFLNTDLRRAKFSQSSLEVVRIVASKLFGASFFEAIVDKTTVEACDLTDVILADAKTEFVFRDCTENVFTRPVIALEWDFENECGWSYEVDRYLEKQEALILHHCDEYGKVSRQELTKEVQEGLAKAHQDPSHSAAYALLHDENKGSAIQALYERAEKIEKYADGLILPGGADVEKEFYDPNFQAGLYQYRNYARSIMEYSLIDLFTQKNKALMGICRGAQIVNTYFKGGTIQNVHGQWKEQKLEFENNESGDILRNKVGNEVWGASMHSQAVDQVGEGLEIALKADGVIKALLGKKSPILLTQFHPERAGAGEEDLIEDLLTNALWNLDEDFLELFIQIFNLKGEKIELREEKIWYLFELIKKEMNGLVGRQEALYKSRLFLDYFLELAGATRFSQPAAVI